MATVQQKEGNQLVMNLGYSHQVIVEEIDGIEIEVPAPDKITIKGIDKQVVGQFAAECQSEASSRTLQGQGHPLCQRGRSPARKARPAVRNN